MLDIFWHYVGRWVVFAIGLVIVSLVVITVVILLWWVFLPLVVLGVGVWLMRLAIGQ